MMSRYLQARDAARPERDGGAILDEIGQHRAGRGRGRDIEIGGNFRQFLGLDDLLPCGGRRIGKADTQLIARDVDQGPIP